MNKILVLDFGGQYAHLIARRFRGLGYYSEIADPAIDIKKIKNVKGIVLSGGPASVYDKNIPLFNDNILKLQIPILGLCYGHQLLAYKYQGTVEKAKVGEYGFAKFYKLNESPLFNNIDFPSQVWMSHSDEVVSLPENFEITGKTNDCNIAAIQNINLKRFGLQFHCEVTDTPIGNKIFDNFAKFCKMKKNWNPDKILDIIKKDIIKQAKNKKVLLFLSGGVDSSVAFALLNETIGKDRVLGLYIDNGFMRKNETQEIKSNYENLGYKNFIIEDASSLFLDAVKNIIDPQEKRKIIGETFLKVRDNIIQKLNLTEDQWLLGQGTLYPDIIESGGTKHSHTIKTHHNRVEGVKQLLEKGLIIEPLKELYKDEVRIIGKKLNLPDEIVFRHPFPGPGLSINILCSDGNIKEIKKFETIKEKINNINFDFIETKNIFLFPLPVQSVGVQGDFRTYSYPISIRIPGIMEDFIGWENLAKISSYLTNNIKETNRVVLELFNKCELKLLKAYCEKQRLDMLREVDYLVIKILKKYNWYNKIFQHLTINLPLGNEKYPCSFVLRPVISEDVMTAKFVRLDLSILKEIISEIQKFEFVAGLYYDITNKPPATFGWE